MTACTILLAAVFTIASAVVQAKQCSSDGECPSDDIPKGVVSLLQSKSQVNAHKDGYQENAAGQRWHPEVHKYIQHLESLEGGPSSLLAERVEVEDPSASGSKTLFIVLSDSSHYSQNLRWISDSWGKDVSSSQLLAIGDAANVGENSTRMRVETTRCPAHTVNGACCKDAEAIITAHQELEKQPNLKWAFIFEDDSYVRAEAMDKQLKLVDPVGEASRGTLVALARNECRSVQCPHGVCGRGGIALSREALTTLVGNSPSKYLSNHMQSCNVCTKRRGDMAIGAQAHAHNINVISHGPITDGMHAWMNNFYKEGFRRTLISAVEPLMYHPMKREGNFKFLDQLFAKRQKGVDRVQFVGGVPSGQCATYNGNTACTSDLRDVPWCSQKGCCP